MGEAAETHENVMVNGAADAGEVVDEDNSIWNRMMSRVRGKPKEGKHRYILPNHMADEESLNDMDKEKLHMQKHYLNNKIRTTKYTVLSFLPKNLFEQFHRFANCYFVFIVLLNFVPAIGAIQPVLSVAPVVVILLVQAIKDIVEDYGRYKSDGLVNNSKTEIYRRKDDKYHNIKWKDVEVGDIVRLFCNSVMPADILLLHSSDEHGVCFIETSNIDGETNLKQRMVCKGVGQDFHAKHFKSLVQCEKPNSQLDKFNGNIIKPSAPRESVESINKENLLLRGCVIRNTDYVEGIVVYAGHETKAMLNNNGPRYKRSKLERRMNLDVMWCVILLVLMCLIGAVGNGVWAAYQADIPNTVLFIPPTEDNETLSPALSGFYMFWTMVILLQVLIPISLYVSIEIVKVGQVFFINNDLEMYDEDADKTVECRALNITEDLGQVQYVFSDKTGTLTENSMVFRRCTVGGVDYPHAANAARIENKEPPHSDMNPAASANNHKQLQPAASAAPAINFQRDSEHGASYRRPRSGSVRAHHRRNPSTLSVRQLRGTVVPNANLSAPNSPAIGRHAGAAQASHRRPAHKHHRRNVSAISAREIASNLASGDRGGLDKEVFLKSEEDDEEEEFLEVDVTPDPVLYKELAKASKRPNDLDQDTKRRRILDFFINLAICNTVVLSSDNKPPNSSPPDDPKDESNFKNRVLSLSSSVSGLFRKSSTMSPVETKGLRNFAEIETILSPADNLETISHQVNVMESTGASADPKPIADQRFSDEYLKNIKYEAESPDEAALVYAAKAYGLLLSHRSVDTVTVTQLKQKNTYKFQVLHTLTFDSIRKRMSVVVRDMKTEQYVLYCKGADSTILSLLKDPAAGREGGDSAWLSSYRESNSSQKCTQTKSQLTQYARAGLRTLCIAKRILTSEEYHAWVEEHRQAEQAIDGREEKLFRSYENLEKDLELLGATGVEDCLQDGVPETIESLRKAGMKVWVITGDKQETAVNIGYSCKLISPDDQVIYLDAESEADLKQKLSRHNADLARTRGVLEDIPPVDQDSSFLSLNALFVQFRSNSRSSDENLDGNHPPLSVVIDGKMLQYALSKDLQKPFIELARRCRSVLVSRATPLQKGQIVKLVKEKLHAMALSIGDGANDVSMIQVADIGVGISGQEGMQAVMSSDFAMPRFRFLQRLLLVHGHWNYARLAMMVLYFFYKNAAFVFLIFWFQFFCGFSGANPIEQWYLLLYSLLFTSIPPLVNGVLDKDISPKRLIQKPRLYLQGIDCEMYTGRSFWINIIDAMYQSVALFFIPYFTYLGSDVGIISWGTPVMTACVLANLVHLGIETKTWTWLHWAAQIGSVVVFFAFSLIYNAVCPACSPPSNPYWIMETLVQTSNFWFSVLLATVTALLPRLVIRSLQSTMWPTECQRERVIEKLRSKKGAPSVDPSGTPLHSGDSSGASSTYQNASYEEAQPQPYPDEVIDYQPPSESDPMYCDIPSRNSNQSNRSSQAQRSPSPRASRPHTAPSVLLGLVNPAYAMEGAQAEVASVASSEMHESETGESRPRQTLSGQGMADTSWSPHSTDDEGYDIAHGDQLYNLDTFDIHTLPNTSADSTYDTVA